MVNRPADATARHSVSPPDTAPHMPGYPSPPESPEGAPSLLLSAIRRRPLFLTLWILLWLAVATAVLITIRPIYQATALVSLQTWTPNLAPTAASEAARSMPLDANLIRSEILALETNEMIGTVIQDLNLVAHPAFTPQPTASERLKATLLHWADQAWSGLGLPDPPPSRALTASNNEAPVDPNNARQAAAYGIYRRGLSVSNDGRSYVVSISFKSADRALAAQIANRHAELYLASQRQQMAETLGSVSVHLDAELQDINRRLGQAERAALDYREKYGLIFRSAEGSATSAVAEQLTSVNRQLATAQAELAQRDARLAALRRAGTVRPSGDSENEVTGSATISRLRDQEAGAARKYADVNNSYGSRHPNVTAAAAELAQVRSHIRDETDKILRGLESEADSAGRRVAELQRTVTQLETQLVVAERAETGLRELVREEQTLRALQEAVVSRLRQARLLDGVPVSNSRIISRASTPNAPVFPNSLLMLAATTMVASSSGVGIVLLREHNRRGFRTIDEVEQALSVRGLGTIPYMRNLRRSSRKLADTTSLSPRSQAAEALWRLRSQLVFAGIAQGKDAPRVIAVTSAFPNEGKTSIAIALAESYATSALRVLLIEADLRKPSIAKEMWENKTTKGIVGLLEGKISYEEAVKSVGPNGPAVLAAERSPSAPQHLLNTGGLAMIVARATKDYDIIIIDTPPVGLVSETLTISREADMAILVVRADATPRRAAKDALTALHRARVPVAGVVLNAANRKEEARLHDYGRKTNSAVQKYFEP